jgi:hypothetical protein
MDWPAQSPDLNPIENLWSIVKRPVAKKKPGSIHELFDVVSDCWNQVTPELCAKLVDSMPRRCAAVIKNFGYPTKLQSKQIFRLITI